jgi:hypothetical protein
MWYQGRHEKEQIKQSCAGTIDGAFRVWIDGVMRGGIGGCEPQDGGVLFSSLA